MIFLDKYFSIMKNVRHDETLEDSRLNEPPDEDRNERDSIFGFTDDELEYADTCHDDF
jgi:hypothetical protein